jgi:hypothetical protein
MNLKKGPTFPSITEILGILTPKKIEKAFDAIQVILKSPDGHSDKYRLLVHEDEFSTILSEKSLISSMASGSMLWTPEEPRPRAGYSSFMLESEEKLAQTATAQATEDTQEVDHSEVSSKEDPTPLSSTEFLLQNRVVKKKISKSNLNEFKKGQKKQTTSFIINKKSN